MVCNTPCYPESFINSLAILTYGRRLGEGFAIVETLGRKVGRSNIPRVFFCPPPGRGERRTNQ